MHASSSTSNSRPSELAAPERRRELIYPCPPLILFSFPTDFSRRLRLLRQRCSRGIRSFIYPWSIALFLASHLKARKNPFSFFPFFLLVPPRTFTSLVSSREGGWFEWQSRPSRGFRAFSYSWARFNSLSSGEHTRSSGLFANWSAFFYCQLVKSAGRTLGNPILDVALWQGAVQVNVRSSVTLDRYKYGQNATRGHNWRRES